LNKIQKDYDENGFAILQNIVPISRINALLENIYNLYKKYSNDTELDNIEIPWDNKLFHEKLIKFRQTEPKLFGAIYDSLKTSLTLTQLVSDDSIVKNIAEFLNVSPSDISISEPMCRLDVPNDKRNALEWHQERSFFPQNRDGKNGLVCWIPLMDVTEKNGAIHVSPKSHNDGHIKTSTKQKDNPTHTTQITVPDENVKKYDELVVPVNAGDVVFFNMLLFHRSGDNFSDRVRIAVQGRYHISTADDFIPFELNNYYNPDIKQKLIKKNYDCSDIPDNIRQPPIKNI
jgi:ectoine hydroxylase-related dioxygenase (phytanoyl-CoA dioxygenase family)